MATTTRASINGAFYDFATIFTFTVWYIKGKVIGSIGYGKIN